MIKAQTRGIEASRALTPEELKIVGGAGRRVEFVVINKPACADVEIKGSTSPSVVKPR